FVTCSFTPPPTSDIYTLSLHDALPISIAWSAPSIITRITNIQKAVLKPSIILTKADMRRPKAINFFGLALSASELITPLLIPYRSEEHTSELQSRFDLVCRLLLEKKKI